MTDLDTAVHPTAAQAPLDAGLADAAGRYHFHPLMYHEQAGEVTVGRRDDGEFVVLPSEGAALLRKLESGMTAAAAADWFQRTYGEPVDVVDFVTDLADLGFVQHPHSPSGPARPVRWQRLGRVVFCPVTAVAYLALLAGWILSMIGRPELIPQPRHLIFTHYISVLVLTLFACQLPLLLLHEAAHALAGRRLGLHSRLSVGRRMQFLVFETTMNGLVAVDRRKRYLPILAGMMTDLAISAIFGLVAAALIRPDGSLGQGGAVALSLSYLTLLRFVWQFWFFLRTDIYYLIVTVLGCVDLHTAAKQQLANTFCRLRGRPAKYDPDSWHPRDRSVARWYAKLMFLGYAASLATLVFGWLPALARIVWTVIPRLFGNNPQGWKGLLDSLVFLAVNLAELLLVASMAIRQRRASDRRAVRASDR
jgi:hypothetical protein